MNQRLLPRLLGVLLLLSLAANGWMLMENRRLLNQWDAVPAGGLQVHVLGAVVQPGVYQLNRGARVADALQAAGGTLPTAELGTLNLAKPLFDGEQVLVPAPVAAAGGSGSESPTASSSVVGGQLINVNTATAAELDTLPYIGPSKAAAIIAYRQQHGAFTQVDDLLQVPGIGEATLAKFRDLVTVK